MSLALPLLAAIVYVIAALMVKRASDLGADVWRVTRMTNYVTAAAAVLLFFFDGTIPAPSSWWQPPFAATLFFSGQIFSLLAIHTGDVSVAAPVLGLKILIVALITPLLIGEAIGARLWTAAVLSTAGIILLNLSPGHPHRRVGRTIVLSGLGAASYACFDVVIQKWSPVWGTGRILPLVMASAAVYSMPLRRLESGSGQDRTCRRATLAGATLFALQGLMFITSISLYRHAATANVLYSSRGLWSVLAVWAVGHWFTNTEQHLGARVLLWRFVGAALMMAAIVMVLFNPRV